LKSEVSYSGKDSYPKDKRQKEGGGANQKYLARKMFHENV